MNKTYYSLLLLLSLAQLTFEAAGQEMVLVVERCKALDQSSPINNIWVDDENVKWVSNAQGLHKVLAIDLVQKVSVPGGMTNLLTIRGGNANMEWNTSEMQALLGGVIISSASYDAKSKSVWIGTQEEGAYQVSLSPLKIIQRINVANKKITSNQINDIFIAANGIIWIATNDGMLSGNGDKWTLQERYLNFVGVDAWGQNMWIMGDDFLWQVDSKGKWTPIAIELKNVEGKLRDIAVDDEGRVWIASNMMTGFDVNASRYQRFGPGQYFTSQYVNCLDVDQDGSIWTGTGDKGLYLIQWEAAMTVNILMDTPLDCKSNQPTAALSVKVSGGEPPFTYKWNSGQTTEKLSQLPAGDYVLTVTDSKGITKTGKYAIPDPGLEVSFEIIKPSSGSPQGDGSVNLLVNGGTGTLKYAWDNGESQQLANKLTSGSHSVTVTDENGCSATTAFSLTEKVTPLAVVLTSSSEIKCGDSKTGSIQSDVKGGKAPITYQWSQGSKTEGKITDLTPGEYSLTVADAAGQTASGYITLTAPAPLQLTIEVLSAANLGMENGQSSVKVTGGKTPYTYKWDNGATTSLVKNLSSGTHSLTVTDANGCISTASVNVSENISALGVIIKQSGLINCNGQSTASLKLDITGGKAPFTYSWSNRQTSAIAEDLMAGVYTVTVTDVVGTKFTASSTITQPEAVKVVVTADAASTTNGSDGKANAKGSGGTGAFQYKWDNAEITGKALKLPAGTHTVTVTDAAGCTGTASIDISENILALQVTIEQTGIVKCAGTTEAGVKAIVKGGKPPYQYKWNNEIASTEILENIGDGLYKLTITDATGQTATSVTTVNSPQPLVLVLKPEQAANTNEKNGRGMAIVTGGTGKYSYGWDNGEKAAKAILLGAGTHGLTVTDENGCTVEGNIIITENILAMSTSIKQSDKILCAGQSTASLSVVTTGGKPPYAITWKGPGKALPGTEKIDQLIAGQYAVQVIDANGSSATSSFEIAEPKPFTLIAEEISPATTGNADGGLTLKAAGGAAGYTMDGKAWPSGTAAFKVGLLKPGNHSFIVTDANGCTTSKSVTITEDILPLTVSLKQTSEVLCAGAAVASIESTTKGGKPPYSYTWNNTPGSSMLSDIAEGTYTVIVYDAAGQKTQAEFKVTGPSKLIVEPTNLRSATNDRINDGKGGVEIKGGAGPYTYKWTSGETTALASKLPLGPGNVVITDNNGCTASAEFIIKEKVLPELTASRLSSGEPIRMEKIQFDADSIVIRSDAIPSIDELYEFLYDNPTIIIEVSGHTNGLPADDYCDRISTARAKSVADYLVSKGIEGRRVISIGYGKRKPVASNQTPEGRKRNQRVEIRLIKIEE
jgi:outer membrane protein OmpA-like peptidoglycan-associated protein